MWSVIIRLYTKSISEAQDSFFPGFYFHMNHFHHFIWLCSACPKVVHSSRVLKILINMCGMSFLLKTLVAGIRLIWAIEHFFESFHFHLVCSISWNRQTFLCAQVVERWQSYLFIHSLFLSCSTRPEHEVRNWKFYTIIQQVAVN